MSLLTGSGRAGRLQYVGVNFAVGVVTVVAVAATIEVDAVTEEVQLGAAAVPVLFASLWLNTTNTIRRMHDRDHSAWLFLLFLVPLVNIVVSLYLLFAPGDRIRNRFGPPPGTPDTLSLEDQRHRANQIVARAANAYAARNPGATAGSNFDAESPPNF